jgi:hypothetical protein
MREWLIPSGIVVGVLSLATFFTYVEGIKYCTVEDQYVDGNPYAKELLLNGFNRSSANRISFRHIEKALEGDRDAINIVIAQTHAPIAQERGLHTTTVYTNRGVH